MVDEHTQYYNYSEKEITNSWECQEFLSQSNQY